MHACGNHHLWCALIQHVRLVVPPRPLQEEAAAVHPIGGRLAAVTVTILDDEIKVNVVDGDLELARVVLLCAGQEGLGDECSGRSLALRSRKGKWCEVIQAS